MNHQEWLEWRRQGLGASDAPILMGVSPWTTPFQLWEEKVFGKTARPDNSNMQYGRDNEEKARVAFEREMNVSVYPKNVVMDEYEWIRASLDGIDLDGKIMVEIKNPSLEDHKTALANKIPEKYFPQLQHQMMVTGLDKSYYHSQFGDDWAIVEVERDFEYTEKLLQIESNFWLMHVINKSPPEMTERDYISMEGETRWKYLVKRRQNVQEDLKLLEKDSEEILTEMIAISGNRNAQGYGFKMSKLLCKGNIDTKRAMEDHPHVAWESYRKAAYVKWNVRAIDP